jgi:hypothetical protein
MQCPFNNKLLHAYKEFIEIWILLRGGVVWSMWIERNENISKD